MCDKEVMLKQFREDIKEAYFKYITDHDDNFRLHEDMDLILKRLARFLLADYPEYSDIIAIYEKAEDDFWYDYENLWNMLVMKGISFYVLENYHK